MSTATVSGLVNWTFKESLGRPTRDYQTMRQPRRSPSGADGVDRCTFTTVDDGSDAGTRLRRHGGSSSRVLSPSALIRI